MAFVSQKLCRILGKRPCDSALLVSKYRSGALNFRTRLVQRNTTSTPYRSKFPASPFSVPPSARGSSDRKSVPVKFANRKASHAALKPTLKKVPNCDRKSGKQAGLAITSKNPAPASGSSKASKASSKAPSKAPPAKTTTSPPKNTKTSKAQSPKAQSPPRTPTEESHEGLYS